MICLKMKSQVCFESTILLALLYTFLLSYNFRFCHPTEDEKDDLPPAEECKAANEQTYQPVGNQTAPEPMKDDTQVNKAFNRLIRGMPKSRRSGILACLASQHESSRKRPFDLIESDGSKKAKVHRGVHDDGSQQTS